MNNKPSISNFVIPKKPRLDPQEPPPPAGTDACSVVFSTKDEFAKVLSLITKNRTVDRDSLSEKNWKIMELAEVKMIRNPTLEKKFNAYKQRTVNSEEFWGYRVVHDTIEETTIVNEGLRAGLDMIPDIGDPAKGVVVYNSPSVAQADRLCFEGPSIRIIMFRTVRGRAREVNLGSGKVAPSPQHNCHVAFKAPFENDDISPASMIQEHRMGAVYHYEFVAGSEDLYKRPSMILPHAILKYKKKDEIAKFGPDIKFLNAMRNSKWISAGTHTIHLKNKSETVEVVLPSTRVECPHVILNCEAHPVVQTMDDIKKYPILRSLRTTHFGKLITNDTVAFNTPIQATKEGGNSATYVLLQTDNFFAEALRSLGRFLVWKHCKWTVFYFPSGHAASEFGFSYKKDSIHVIIACKGIENGTHNQLIGPDEPQDMNWLVGDSWSEFEHAPESAPGIQELHPSVLKQPERGILRESNFRSKHTARVTFCKESDLVQTHLFDPYFEDEEPGVDVRAGALQVNPSMSFDDKRKQERLNAKEAIVQQGNNEIFRGAMMKTQSTRKGSEESEVSSVNLMNLHPTNVRVDPASMNASMHRNSYESSDGPRPIGDVPRHSVPPPSLSLHPTPQLPSGILPNVPNGPPLPPAILGVPPPQHTVTRHHLPDPRFGPTPPMIPARPMPSGSPPVDFSRPPPPFGGFPMAPPTILQVVSLSSQVPPRQLQGYEEIGEAAMDVSMDDRDEENDELDDPMSAETIENPEQSDDRHHSEDEQNEDEEQEDDVRQEGVEEVNDILAMALTPATRPEEVAETATPSVSNEMIAKALAELTPTAVETIKNLQILKQKKVETAPLEDTDLRIPAPIAITSFSINAPKQAVNLLKPSVNVLGDDDDDDDEKTDEPRSSARKSQDVDYRKRPSAPIPKKSLHPEFPKDRDDRRKDIDERFSSIPLPREVSDNEKQQRKIKDSLQGKLRETGKVRETVVQDNCMKIMSQGSFQQAPVEAATTSSEVANNYIEFSKWVFGPGGLQSKPPVENTQQPVPVIQEPEPVPEPEPEQMRSPEEERYVPISFLNQQLPEVPTKTKETHLTHQQQDVMPNIGKDKSPRKNSRKPVDYDQTRGNRTHDRISEGWMKTLVKKDQKSNRSQEVEEGEIESDDERNKSKASDTSTSSSDIIILEEVINSPGTVQRTSGSQEGSSNQTFTPRNIPRQQPRRSFYRSSQKSFGISSGDSDRNYGIGHQSNLPTSSARAEIPEDSSETINCSIFVDPDMNSLRPESLKALFDELVKLKRVPIQKRRFDGTVYLHKQVFDLMSSDQKKSRHLELFEKYSDDLVKKLPEHDCDLTKAPRMIDAAECMHRTNEKMGGMEAIFLTHNHRAESPFGRELIKRRIRLVSVKELQRYIDGFK